ncbi:MAG TPA: aminotransferase class V-fold PLP-dependent enzyme [Solirubrobacteraceae bacterium]
MARNDLRDEFPVLSRLAYLNAGTDGPLPESAVRAAAEELAREAGEGRAMAHFERRTELGGELRGAYAAALGCDPQEVALTTCTSEGIAQVIGGLDLDSGDEILTSDEEHPGLLGALAGARDVRGVTVRMVPLPNIADAVDPRKTRLVACSHVGWMSGRLAPVALSRLRVPVLLDGAQGVGAIPVDVRALGCDAYAGAGQKWMCGPDGTGMLYVSADLRARLAIERRGYSNLADPNAGVDASLHEDARALETMSLSAETLACALAAARVLEAAGRRAVHERARGLAGRLVELLGERGRAVASRGDTTLVSFESPDPEREREHLRRQGVIVRNIPGAPWLRASVGAWNNEDDLDRLMDALTR